jgi:succinate dehydrogenase / fumarate reductase flavoprotein subunit/fumarate reductase flavoprotein subunit
MDLMLRKLKHIESRLRAIGRSGVNTRFLEIKNMVTIANLVTTAARMRKESRGTHYRADYPATNNKKWLKHICLQQKKEKLHISFT